CPLSGDVTPPLRLGAAPWSLRPEAIEAARPERRAWGAAWLLLLESGEPVAIADFTDLVCGGTQPAQLAACWLTLVGGQSWFRLRQGQIEARSAAELRNLRRERRRKALIEQQERAWLELLRRRQPLEPASLSPDHRQRLEQLKQLAGGGIELAELAAPLRQSLATLHLGSDHGALRHLLVELGQWDPHQLLSLAGTPWSTGFSAAQEAEACRLLALHAAPLPGDEARLDLSGQRCVTIDDDDTRDIDDGLALERRGDGALRLWIHVADPDRLIEAGSPLDLEARRRGSSLYLARGNQPMFPESLSAGPLSLRQGVRSAAWSTWVELSGDGAIAAYGIGRSWVQPTFRLSYADADDLIDLAPPEEPDLADLERLLQRRRSWRVAQGALLLDLPEGRIRCRDGEPLLEISEPSPSRHLVAEAMILAGAAAASFGIEHGLALPYRSQPPAELPPAAELQALPEGAVRFAAIKRCLSRGLMGTQPSPHFSLGLPAYVQATSPIRRYGDLLVQRQIGAQLSEGPLLAEPEVQALIEEFDGAVREGIGISREDQRHWQQVWFETHRSGQWRAEFLRWLRPQDRLGLVRIDELAIDLAAECPQNAQPGAGLLLRVQQVDSLRDQLKLVCLAS
ncbi:MAG: ribonuclease catalytic domain-containing protein, partial [Prochlorococcaceae cyanobacterium]